jgi:hypothetical protein
MAHGTLKEGPQLAREGIQINAIEQSARAVARTHLSALRGTCSGGTRRVSLQSALSRDE